MGGKYLAVEILRPQVNGNIYNKNRLENCRQYQLFHLRCEKR